MKKILNWLIQQYKTASVAERLYALAMAIFLAGQLLTAVADQQVLEVSTGLAMVVLISGFVMWCLPTVRWLYRAWDRPFAKTPIIIVHIFVVLVATVLARSLVAESLGLPPQSFDLTTSFLTLFFYVPAWMIVAAVILAIVGFVLAAIAILQLPLEGALQQLIIFVRAFGVRVHLRQTRGTILLHCSIASAHSPPAFYCFKAMPT